MSEKDVEQNIDRISEEEKEVILENTDKLIDEMTKNQEQHDKDYDEWKKSERKGQGNDSESYDMNEARKNAVKKKEKNQHRLGFHRRYLESPTRVSNVILAFIFAIIAIILAVSFLMPNVLPKAPL